MLLSAGAVLLVSAGRMCGAATVCESFSNGKLSISELSVDVGDDSPLLHMINMPSPQFSRVKTYHLGVPFQQFQVPIA